MITLEKEFNYYIDHRDQLVKDYGGRYIVIKDDRVIGDYNTQNEAIEKTIKNQHELGTFLVQHVQTGDESISQTFHSRVVFNAN